MPYRRLPNTDQARLRALKKAIQETRDQSYHNQVVQFAVLLEAQNVTRQFENYLLQYQRTLENQVSANKQYQQVVQKARLYISHFIQVFNLAVIRGEIKKEHKLLYQLDPDIHNVPDLSNDEALLQWGKCIIEGENERVRKGGVQIYNPTITKVKVHYEIFKEYNTKHKLYQNTTMRNRGELASLREKCDEIICTMWNQIEDKFKDLEPLTRLNKCQQYGVIYYYRKGETKLEEKST